MRGIESELEAIQARVLADIDPAITAALKSTAEALQTAETHLQTAQAELASARAGFTTHDRKQAASSTGAGWQHQRRSRLMAIDDATAEYRKRASAAEEARAAYIRAHGVAWVRAIQSILADHARRRAALAEQERAAFDAALQVQFDQLSDVRKRAAQPEVVIRLMRSGWV